MLLGKKQGTPGWSLGFWIREEEEGGMHGCSAQYFHMSHIILELSFISKALQFVSEMLQHLHSKKMLG